MSSDKDKILYKSGSNVLKVVALGLRDRIYDEMKSSSFTVEGVTRKINAEGVKITSQSIRKFIQKTKDAQRKLIRKDLAAAESIKQLTIDYGNTLKNILKEVEEMKDLARENKDMQTYNQLIGKIYQGIELIAKLTGDMNPNKSIDIKIVYNEINTNVENTMKDMKNAIFKDKVVDVDAEIIEDDKKAEEELKNG